MVNKTLTGMVVPATANASEVPRCCRNLDCKDSWSSACLQSLRVTFEDKYKVQHHFPSVLYQFLAQRLTELGKALCG